MDNTNETEVNGIHIQALRCEAAEAGDSEMVAICDRALRDREDHEAWGKCERVIREARANDDSDAE